MRTLPPTIASYVQATNKHDTQAILTCFADNAFVADDGQEMRGTCAIQAWIEKTTQAYMITLDVTDVIEQNDELVVTAQVSGNFDGSPFPFMYTFKLDRDKIAALKIEA